MTTILLIVTWSLVVFGGAFILGGFAGEGAANKEADEEIAELEEQHKQALYAAKDAHYRLGFEHGKAGSYDDGLNAGLAAGKLQGFLRGIATASAIANEIEDRARNQGFNDGYQQGFGAGYDDGRADLKLQLEGVLSPPAPDDHVDLHDTMSPEPPFSECGNDCQSCVGTCSE